MTAPPTGAPDFDDCLSRQLASLRALRDALEAEAAALRSSSPDALDEALGLKTRCLAEVEEAAVELLDHARARGFDGASDRLERWLAALEPAAGARADTVRAVRAEALACQALNRRNGAVIEGTRQELADALSALHGHAAPPANTYDATGGRSGPSGNPIGQA